MRRFLAVLAAAALLLTACGSDGSGPDPAEDPKGALSSALERLNDGITLTVTLDSTEESLSALSEGDLTSDVAATILDSSLVFSSKGDTPEDVRQEVFFNISGTDGVEMKALGEEIYLRADVRGIAEVFGAPMESFEQGVADAQKQPGFEFLEPAVAGEWLHLIGAKEAMQQFGAMPAASPDEETQKKFADELRAAIDEHATVESVGTDDIGEHLVVSVNIKGFFSAVMKSTASLLPGAPPGLPTGEDLPDKDAKLDVWVNDGNLERASFDFLQLPDISDEAEVPAGVEELAVVFEFDPYDGDVEVPSDAQDVDLRQLMQQFFMGAFGQSQVESGEATVTAPGGDASQTEELCAQLEEAPDDVKKEFVDQCPDLVN